MTVINLRRRPTEARAARWDSNDQALRSVLEVAGELAGWAEYAGGTLHLMPADGPLLVMHPGQWLVRHEDGRLVAVDQAGLDRGFERVEPPARLAAVAG